jgi:hypothetical protein
MAAVKRVAAPEPVRSATQAIGGGVVTLPTAPSEPSHNLSDYTWLIYGEKKIGKTSLAARFPQALFAMFEPGGKALRIFQTPVLTKWGMFLDVVRQLEAGRHAFKTVVIDPGNTAYDRALEYVCQREGIVHPGRVKDYGASWKAVSSEFQTAHTRLSRMAFIVLAHAKAVEIETASGESYNRICPVMSGATEEFYAGVIDIIGYYHFVGRERYLQIRGDDLVQAGCRCEENFTTPKGEPVVRIPMGHSPAEAYANIVAAFNNKQPETYADVSAELPRGGAGKVKLIKKNRD